MTTTAPFETTCPACQSRFPIDPSKVPPDGVHAICSECWRVFQVTLPADGTAAEASDAPGPFQASPDRAEVDAAPQTQEARLPDPEPEWSPFEDLAAVTREQVEEEEEEGAGEERAESAEREPTETPGASRGDAPDTTEAEGSTSEAPDTGRAASPFAREDPHHRARRLARVLVSDMITYHPQRHARALEEGSLEADFEDEVQKSWEEYVEQVGAEIAEGTRYFQDALNEILARGRSIY